jgi:putative urate catabolism protein
MAWQPTRDFIGYGANPPDPKWPNGARLALNFVMNYEEGSEPSMQDGEGYTETGLTESWGRPQDVKSGRDLAGEGMFEYGSRVGFWRLMRLFQERRLPLTVFGCALALERNPPAAQAIREAGFDVCCHGWRWIKHYELTEAEEREHIRKAIASLQGTVGARPLGWYCRYGPSVNTRRLVAEEGGFLYDSDSYADELPFWQTVEGKPHLVVPYSLTNNDGKYAGWMGTSEQWFSFVRDAFDMLYAEGEKHPKMMSVGLHMRLIGHPARAVGLQRLLDYVQRHDHVWITSRINIARHWIATHPYPGKGLNE